MKEDTKEGINDMEFYYSKSKIMKMFFLMFGLLFIIYVKFKWLMPVSLGANPVYIAVIILWLGVFVPKLLKKDPVLIINENGILDSSIGYGLIPWSEIISLEIAGSSGLYTGGIRTLCINVRDFDKYVNKVSFLSRFFISLKQYPILISFMYISPGLNELWEYLRKEYSEKINETSFTNPKRIAPAWKMLVVFVIICLIIILISRKF